MTRVLRVALWIGAVVDGAVAVLSLFFQSSLGPLLDIPVKDPALTTIAGGEFAVVTLLYVAIARDVERYRPLLWLVALDQLFGGLLPALEILRGHVPATWKTVGPIPFDLALAAIYVAGARAGRTAADARAPGRG